MERELLTTPRLVTRSIAAVIEELELRQPTLVTDRTLSAVLGAVGSPLRVGEVADRLVRAGWLLPLRTRRSWEFAPAARAGRHGSDDDWIELRAVLAHQPDAPVALAFESAAWAVGYAEHRPSRPVYVHRPGWRPPRSLDHLRAVTFDWYHPAGDVGGLPVLDPATVVVALAERPEQCGDWANADTWLGEMMRATSPDPVVHEARSRNAATLARLGYMAEWIHRYDIADAVRELLPARLGVTYLGPRGPGARFSARWRVYDAVLPELHTDDDDDPEAIAFLEQHDPASRRHDVETRRR